MLAPFWEPFGINFQCLSRLIFECFFDYLFNGKWLPKGSHFSLTRRAFFAPFREPLRRMSFDGPLVNFGLTFGSLFASLGSLWARFWHLLASFWLHFGSLWAHFRSLFVNFWCSLIHFAHPGGGGGYCLTFARSCFSICLYIFVENSMQDLISNILGRRSVIPSRLLPGLLPLHSSLHHFSYAELGMGRNISCVY
jgi:hypothetical protein